MNDDYQLARESLASLALTFALVAVAIIGGYFVLPWVYS